MYKILKNKKVTIQYCQYKTTVEEIKRIKKIEKTVKSILVNRGKIDEIKNFQALKDFIFGID